MSDCKCGNRDNGKGYNYHSKAECSFDPLPSWQVSMYCYQCRMPHDGRCAPTPPTQGAKVKNPAQNTSEHDQKYLAYGIQPPRAPTTPAPEAWMVGDKANWRGTACVVIAVGPEAVGIEWGGSADGFDDSNSALVRPLALSRPPVPKKMATVYEFKHPDGTCSWYEMRYCDWAEPTGRTHTFPEDESE